MSKTNLFYARYEALSLFWVDFGCNNECYLSVQALQVGADVLDAGSERMHMQER